MEDKAQYLVAMAEELMTIHIMVPQLLKERGLSPGDLMYGARLSPKTAYVLVDEEKCKNLTSISFDVLTRLCQFFNVEPGDILKLEEKQQEGN